MEIGIGLPTTIPGVEGRQVLEWARRAEDAGFSSLATLDRIVYPNYEPLVALGAVAAVTERIRLMTAILITPYRTNTTLLAKELATLHHLSGGRLVVGAGIGARGDDYEGSRVTVRNRGRRFDEQLDELRRVWAGEERGFAGGVGPVPPNGGPSIIVGGKVDEAFERAARTADGWIAGAGNAGTFGAAVEKLEAAWARAGREDKPRAIGFLYFALGPDAARHADAYLHDYYGFAGPYADTLTAATPVDAERIREYVASFEAARCDELLLFPCSADPEQVDLLAEVVAPARTAR